MASLIDISMPLSDRIPVWPQSPGAVTTRLQSIAAGAEAEVSSLTMEVHTGTHLDCPAHMIAGAETTDDYALDTGLGEALVLYTGEAGELDVAAGRYELLCLPLRLTGCEAAPARAVLRRLDG